MSDTGSKWGTAIKLQKGLRIIPRQAADGIVWYREERVKENGVTRVVRTSLETSDMKVAREKAIAGPEAPAARPFPASLKKDDTVITLDKAFTAYEEWFKKGHKESAWGVTLPAVEKFTDKVGLETETRAVTREHVQEFLDSFDHHSPIYVKNQWARVRAFLRWIDQKYRNAIDPHCLKGIDLPKDESVTAEVPPMQTIKALLQKLSAHPWLGDLCSVLLETGMRPGELLAVRGVDLRDNLLDIRPYGDWSPKNKWSVRTIVLSPAAAAILEARKEKLFDKRAPIFGTDKGTIRDAKDVGRQYREASKVDDKIPAELEDFNLYAFRHAFASFHAKSKIDKKPNPAFMPLADLGKYMGHSPGSTHTLERWYVDRRAEDLGAPASLVGEAKDGKVIEMKAKGS
jgi:integrase